MTGRRTFRPAEIADQLAVLDCGKGGVLLVHTAWRQVRPVEGGLAGLIEALRPLRRRFRPNRRVAGGQGSAGGSPVGHAHARLTRAQDVVRIAVARLKADAAFLREPEAGCDECDEARASVSRADRP